MRFRRAVMRSQAVLFATTAHPTKPVTQLKITVKRQDGETVLEGEAWCYR